MLSENVIAVSGSRIFTLPLLLLR